MSRPHAPDVRAVDPRLRFLRRREDAKLGDALGAGDLGTCAVIGDLRIRPVGIRALETDPGCPGARLEHHLRRTLQVDMDGLGLALLGDASRSVDDLAVEPDTERRTRLARRASGNVLRVAVNADDGVEGRRLSVQRETDRAFRPHADTTFIAPLAQANRIPADGGLRPRGQPHAAAHPRKVELIDENNIGHACQGADGHERSHKL